MTYVLVTNDDGIDSPALVPLIRALEAQTEIRTVVPDGERSWIGKAISRWHEIPVRQEQRDGLSVWAVGGYPADCANLGVHSLFDERPELIVSGVNIGLNTGLGFFLSSGTVGAAMEGWIAGVPALAFSIGVQGDDRSWKSRPEEVGGDDLWQRAAAVAADIVSIVRKAGYPPDVDLISVNMPLESNVDTPRVLTQLAVVGYDQLFRRKSAGVFVHDFNGLLRGTPRPTSDIAALRGGRVSITPVRLARTAAVSDETRRLLERG